MKDLQDQKLLTKHDVRPMSFRGPGFGQFGPGWHFPSGVASFLGEFLDLFHHDIVIRFQDLPQCFKRLLFVFFVSSRNRDAFLQTSRIFEIPLLQITSCHLERLKPHVV